MNHVWTLGLAWTIEVRHTKIIPLWEEQVLPVMAADRMLLYRSHSFVDMQGLYNSSRQKWTTSEGCP